jgi:hypothetical protein
MQPIAGQRFACESCPAGPDNDLCEACHRRGKRGKHAAPAEHRFHAHDGLSADGYEPWLTVPRCDVRTPHVPDRFVVRPEFRIGRETFFGAYAFVVEDERGDAPLVLTALHVMDELLKSNRIEIDELPRIVTEVGLYDVFAPNWVFAELGTAHAMLTLPHARLGEEEPYTHGDVAAFRASMSARVTPRPLARDTPRVGEPLWLAYRRRDVEQRLIAAVVVASTERMFVFRFLNPAEVAPLSSGAPLLDRDGCVAGINIGAGVFRGERFGHANPVASVRRHLADSRHA